MAMKKSSARKPPSAPSGKGKIKLKPGKESLHKATDTPKGKPISAAALAAAKKSKSAKVRQKANFAANAKNFKH